MRATGLRAVIVLYAVVIPLLISSSASAAFIYKERAATQPSQDVAALPGIGRETGSAPVEPPVPANPQRHMEEERAALLPAPGTPLVSGGETDIGGPAVVAPPIPQKLAVTSVYMNHGGPGPSTPVPEPGAVGLVALGVLGLARRWRRGS